jgi:hypothetical protein
MDPMKNAAGMLLAGNPEDLAYAEALLQGGRA